MKNETCVIAVLSSHNTDMALLSIFIKTHHYRSHWWLQKSYPVISLIERSLTSLHRFHQIVQVKQGLYRDAAIYLLLPLAD